RHHHGGAAAEERRDQRLRGDRGDAQLLHPPGARAEALHRPAGGDRDPVGDHGGGEAGGAGQRRAGRGEAGVPGGRADGGGDRRGPAGDRADGKHDRGHRGRDERDRGDLAGGHHGVQVGAGGGGRLRPRDRGAHGEDVQP